MDHHHQHDHGSNAPLRGTIPRLSRLPMPRAVPSTDNLRLSARTSTVPTVHPDDICKNSHLPRPLGPTGALGENINQSIRSRYGWTDKPTKPRSESPVRDALRDAKSTTMDTTPPGPNSDAPVFEDGNENPTAAKTEKRRPRPSLSERTMETLSQLSPSPSPAPRRANTFSNDGIMAPPLMPASSVRDSRPSTPAGSRPDSPTKRPFRPPGRSSPTKDLAPLPPVISPGDIYTPPKAFVKGQRSRIAKPLPDSRRSVSYALEHHQESGTLPHSRVSAQTMNIKPPNGSKTVSSHSSTSKPHLASIFREPYPSAKPNGKLAVSGVGSPPALLKPRSRGENSIAPSTPPSARSKKSHGVPILEEEIATTTGKDPQAKNSSKSSAVLRETIAKAKAARRKALETTGTTTQQTSAPSAGTAFLVDEEEFVGGANEGLLRKRVQQAVTTGQLNIARMNLKHIPLEVMKMYDPEISTTAWSDMVDLVKFNAADNELEELKDGVFPDYVESELADEDERSQFGGLEVLDLHRNQLQTLPVGLRRLDRLHSLNLSSNKLTSSALEIIGEIPNLKELIMTDNLIEGTLGFNHCRFERLQLLDLHGNDIQSFDTDGFAQLKNLKVFKISGNKLSMLPWEALATLPLTELNVSKNRLCGMLFPTAPAFPELRVLDASQNSLEHISEDDLELPSLRSLVLSGNRLTNLPSLTHCKQLQTLEVSENQLDELPARFADLKSLKSADFGHNNVRLVCPEIARMESLSSLNLVGNPLREKKFLAMSITELKLDLDKKLDTTQEESVSSDAANLPSPEPTQYRYKPSRGILDLSSRSLSTISPGEIDLGSSDSPIHTLKLSNNDLTSFPTELLAHPALKYSLQSLDLSHNPLLHPTEYLCLELFLPILRSLYIVSTGLTSLDALTTHLKAPALAELNISCHRLTGHVPWVRAWWPNCHTLLATDNWFNSVDLEGVRGLEVLDIRNNEIDSLPAMMGLLGNHPGTTKQPGRLRVLEVSGNKFRVPRLSIVEKGTEAVLRDLRRMVAVEEVPEEWRDAI